MKPKRKAHTMCARALSGAEGNIICTPVKQPRQRIRLCMTRVRPAGRSIRSPEDACNALRGEEVGRADRESFYALHLDTRNRVIGVEEVARGTLNDVTTHPREIFKAAILNNAAAVILAHNHPSDDLTPSTADITLTKTAIESGKLLGIPVLDHMIVGESACASLRTTRTDISFNGSYAKTKPSKPR